MLGISYPGWLTVMALLEPHPALKAASPQAPPADMFLGDDFHHNGAFRLSYGFEYAALMETSKVNARFKFDRRDTFEWYLRLGPLSNANARHLKGKIPTWNDFVEHPSYDEFWRRQAVAPYLGRPKVPTLNVAGWWDQEDFYGPLKVYETFEKSDSGAAELPGGRARGTTAAGPAARATGWARSSSARRRASTYRAKIQAPWFAAHLKDRGSRVVPRGRHLPHRVEHLAVVRSLAAPRGGPAAALRPQGRPAGVRAAPRRRERPRLRRLPLRSRPSRPLPAAAHHADLSPAPSGRSGWSRTSGSSTFAPTS